MTKIKEWIKEHKKELIIASVSVAAGAIGGVSLYNYSRKDVERWKNEVVGVYNVIFPAMKGSNGAYLGYDYTGTKTVKDCPELMKNLISDTDVCKDLDEEITGIAIFRKIK